MPAAASASRTQAAITSAAISTPTTRTADAGPSTDTISEPRSSATTARVFVAPPSTPTTITLMEPPSCGSPQRRVHDLPRRRGVRVRAQDADEQGERRPDEDVPGPRDAADGAEHAGRRG